MNIICNIGCSENVKQSLKLESRTKQTQIKLLKQTRH